MTTDEDGFPLCPTCGQRLICEPQDDEGMTEEWYCLDNHYSVTAR